MALTLAVQEAPEEYRMTLGGELDAAAALQFKEAVEKAAGAKPKRLVLFMNKLTFMASAGLRVLIFAKQKMGTGVSIYVVGCQGPVQNTLEMSGFHQSVFMQSTYSPQ